MSDLNDHVDRMFREDVSLIAQRLRRIADEVEEVGKPVPNHAHPERGLDYTRAATRVIHAVTWGVANLTMESLVTLIGELREKP